MPWAVAAAAVVAATAQTTAADTQRKAYASRHQAAPPKPPPPATHCAPCGAPLEASVCSYCRTPAPGWRNQAAAAPLSDGEFVVDVRYGYAVTRPEWATRPEPPERAAHAAAAVMKEATPHFVEKMREEPRGGWERPFVAVTEQRLAGDDLAQKFATDAVWHAAGVYTPTFGPGVDVTGSSSSSSE